MYGGHWRIGVPPGVGDTYRCLTKLQALRAAYGVERVTLCVQKSPYDRAIGWADMVDFVDDASIVVFDPGPAKKTGYLEGRGQLDCVLWPNAVLDRGGHLDDWLPTLTTDLSFPVRTTDMGPPRVVVYASSVAINAQWMRRKAGFWSDVIASLSALYGTVTVVGADWDKKFRDRLRPLDVEDLVGQTTLPELAGIVRSARVVVGVICGVTILANHFRTPVVALYPDHRFPKAFPRSWVAPDAPYRAPAASNATVASVVRAATEIVR